MFLLTSRLQKQQENKGTKEIVVLDHKRSNAINICMTKLPPPRTIKTAILKMDATIINKEGIEASQKRVMLIIGKQCTSTLYILHRS